MINFLTVRGQNDRFCRLVRSSTGNYTILSPENATKILVLHNTLNGGKASYSDVATEMKNRYGIEVTRQTVGNIVNRKLSRGTTDRKPGSGRPRKTTQRDDMVLRRLVLKNRKQTFGQLKTEFEESTKKSISIRTTGRRLAEYNISNEKCAKKPTISKQNRKKRLKWARDHKSRGIDFWRKIIWSDESRFCMFSDRPQRCFRMPHERLKPDCLQNTVKFGGASCMIWGCFMDGQIGRMVSVNTTINSQVYTDILDNFLIPSMEDFATDDAVFQQDGARCHTASDTMNWLKSRNIDTITDWPPQSPDLNPIEHVWDWIDRRLHKTQFRNKKELVAEVTKLWESIPSDYLKGLIESMPRRIDTVIKNNGGPTKY